MNDTKVLIEKIKEGIQEKKGKNIVFRGVKFVRDYFTLYFYKLDKLDY